MSRLNRMTEDSTETSSNTLSIVIGTCNRCDLLKMCLEALLSTVKTPCEIIVIDAGSTDGTLPYLRADSRIKLVEDGECLGQAKSLNAIFKTVRSKYTCWLSDDNVVQPGGIDAAVKVLDEHPDIGMVALKTCDVAGKNKNVVPYIGGIWPSGVLNVNQGMIRTELLHKLGGFDEEFRDYGIDADLTTRVLLEGHKVAYTRKVAIHHYRDHDQVSWIQSVDERRRRMTAAKVLYADRFKVLLVSEASMLERGVLGILSWLYNNCLLIKRMFCRVFFRDLGTGGQSSLERDLLIVAKGRFISLLDLFWHRRTDHYLVQSMPRRLRRRQHNVDCQSLKKIHGDARI